MQEAEEGLGGDEVEPSAGRRGLYFKLFKLSFDIHTVKCIGGE